MPQNAVVGNYWETRSPGLKHSDYEVGTEKFYDEVEKKRYEDPFKYKYLKEVAEFNRHNEKKVLEVGVGLGTDSLQFAKNGSKSFGIDLTFNGVSHAKRRFTQKGISGSFNQADFTKIPFSNNSFDVVYSFGVLHHSEGTQQGIDEIFRVLKPGGKAIIMLYHKGFKYYIRKLLLYGVLKGELLKYSAQDIINRHSEDFGNCPLTKAYNRAEASLMFSNFKNVSFECFRMDDYFYLNGKQVSPAMSLLPKKLFRALENKWGWNLVIKGEKPSN